MNFWQVAQASQGASVRGRGPSVQCDIELARPVLSRQRRHVVSGQRCGGCIALSFLSSANFQASDVRQVQQRGLNEGSCKGSLAHDIDERGTENTTSKRDLSSHTTRAYPQT